MKEIIEYIEKSNWRVNENANTGFSISGLKSYISSTILARHSLSRLPKNIRDAHKNGEIHIHDLDGSLYSPYCVSGITSIQMIDGWKFASDIKIGDILIGYNELSKKFEHTEVKKVFCREVEEIYQLKILRSDNVNVNLQITGNHKVLTNSGWKSVEELNTGDEILYLTQTRRNNAKFNEETIIKEIKQKLTHEERSEIQKNSSTFEYNKPYWHKNTEKDKEREKELIEQGWQVFNINNEKELTLENIQKFVTPKNVAILIGKKLLISKSVGKRKYKFKVYNFHCSPHENYLANSLIVHNCFGADLQQLMFEGLKNPIGSMSTPAKHFDSMVDHMVNYLYMSQNEFNGAQAFSNVDTLLSGYVIGHDYNYIKQSIQRLIYNISYPLRSAFQTPFINFSFDLIPPKHMENEPVLIGGKTSESLSYKDMQKEMDMINKAFLEIMLAGDSQGKPFTFPIPTYGITKELLNKNDEVTNLLWQLSAKFGNPNFMNYIGTNADPSDVRAMCCRLSLDISKLRGRGLWNMGNKTGSLGVITLNLNHASKDGEDHFIERIDDYFDMAIQELSIKRKYIYEAFNKGLLPFTKCYLNNKDPFATFFNTIGIHAMNEACINMFGETIEFHQNFVEEILNHIRKRTDETTNETGILHNLEQTPCEGASYRLAKLDKKFGLSTQGLKNPFLTNSTHCPVNTIFDWTITVKIQEKFNKYYSGGTIMHGFTGDDILPKRAEKIIKQMSTETTIPYYNLTPTYSICKDHGRFVGKVLNCPICNNINYIYSRVVGYLQPVQKWNNGKQEEFKMRKEFKMG